MEQGTQNKKDRRMKLILAIIASLAIALNFKFACNSEKKTEIVDQINNIDDSLNFYKNKHGQVVTEKKSLEISFDLFKEIKNKEIAELKSVVTKRTLAATSESNKNNIEGAKPTIVSYIDSSKIDSTNCENVVFSTIIHDSILNPITNKFDTLNYGKVVANKDSIKYKVISFDNQTVDQSWTKYRLFKKQELMTSFKHSNPNIRTTKLQSYSKPIPKSKLFEGVGIGVVGTLIIVETIKLFIIK